MMGFMLLPKHTAFPGVETNYQIWYILSTYTIGKINSIVCLKVCTVHNSEQTLTDLQQV